MKDTDVIISTYNWSRALERTLYGFIGQTQKRFGIIIADDGSGDATRELLERVAKEQNIRITHCWQKDKGFRKARILNKAVKISNARQIIFTDQDTIPHYDFVKEHNENFVNGGILVGGYMRLSRDYTEKLSVEKIKKRDYLGQLTKKRKRELWWKHFKSIFYICNPLHNHRPSIMGLNFSVDREAFVRVNGFDMHYEGWGQEDSDLANRMWKARIPFRSFWNVCFAFHQWHPQNPSKKTNRNRKYYKRRNAPYFCENGLLQTELPIISTYG
jgi:glycosyltransferase involved in cell wall biosynthesis